RGAADRGDAFYPVREQCPPMKCLLRPHREPIDEMDPLDPEHLLHQALLDAHIVGHCEMRVSTAIEGRRRIARRGRQAVAELVYDNDEVAGRVERLARGD